MINRSAIRAVVCIALLTALAAPGCALRNKSLSARPSPSPVEKLAATAGNLTVAYSDKAGLPVVHIAAKSAAGIGASGDDGQAVGQLRDATATLYQHGKAAATLTADTLHADSATRVVTATGNAVVRSLGAGRGGSVRADTMRWEYDRDHLDGTGNIVLTYGEQVRMPGKSFVANTQLESATVTGGDAPITGKY